MLLIFLILIFLLVLSVFLKEFKYGRVMIGLITYSIIIVVSGKITYTPDWEGYEFLMNNNNRIEYVFTEISNFAIKNGLTYKHVHFFYISIYTIFLLWIISIFNKNIFIVSLIYLIFVFLFYTTQIRFFMGYYAGILALYYFLQDRRLILSIALFLFAVLNHTSLLILLIYIPLYSINIYKLPKTVTIIAGVSFIFFFLIDIFTPITTLIDEDLRYSGYFSIESRSSILGGFAFLLPFFIFFPFLIKYYFKVRNNLSSQVQIKQIDFLYKMAIIPIVFIGLSLYIQIIGHRFIIPSMLMSLLLYFQLRTYDKKNNTPKYYFFAFLIFGVLYYYLLLPALTGSGNNGIISRILDSNPIINYLMF